MLSSIEHKKINVYSNLYKDIEKVKEYWNGFKPSKTPAVNYIEKWKTLSYFFEQISSQNNVMVLLWDVIDNCFIYAVDSRKITGYECSLYTASNGVDFSISNIHPDYLPGMLAMQQTAFDYIMNRETGQNNIIVNMDCLYKKSNGDYFHLLQQVVCLEMTDQGHPLLFLSYIHDITFFKKEGTSNLAITSPDDARLWNFDFEGHCLEPQPALSTQEKKVLAHLAQGKSSKMIASELFLSPHTVDTHRRNLLRKLNCNNTTGVVLYAKLVGLI